MLNLWIQAWPAGNASRVRENFVVEQVSRALSDRQRSGGKRRFFLGADMGENRRRLCRGHSEVQVLFMRCGKMAAMGGPRETVAEQFGKVTSACKSAKEHEELAFGGIGK